MIVRIPGKRLLLLATHEAKQDFTISAHFTYKGDECEELLKGTKSIPLLINSPICLPSIQNCNKERFPKYIVLLTHSIKKARYGSGSI